MFLMFTKYWKCVQIYHYYICRPTIVALELIIPEQPSFHMKYKNLIPANDVPTSNTELYYSLLRLR